MKPQIITSYHGIFNGQPVHGDENNKPYERKCLILESLLRAKATDSAPTSVDDSQPTGRSTVEVLKPLAEDANEACPHVREYSGFDFCDVTVNSGAFVPLSVASRVHATEMIDFLASAWAKWSKIDENLRDDAFVHIDQVSRTKGETVVTVIPSNHTNRDPYQLPGSSVKSQLCYYATDRTTPVYRDLEESLRCDMSVIYLAAHRVLSKRSSNAEEEPFIYALTVHPGHHASRQSFGGYCYLNNVAVLASLLLGTAPMSGIGCRQDQCPYKWQSSKLSFLQKVAVIDVDYHAGNGTASIFYDQDNVFVASIHMDPNYEYPFTFGFSEQKGCGKGEGKTLNLPLPARTGWAEYQEALDYAIQGAENFGAEAVIVSLGLDTYKDDQVVTPGAGFTINLPDYRQMGQRLGQMKLPIIVVQEGGYCLKAVGPAVHNFLEGISFGLGGHRGRS